MIDINEYIGKRWVANGKGPDTFDCWGLVADVYAKHLGLALPEFDITPYTRSAAIRALTSGCEKELELGNFIEVDEPQDYDVIMLENHHRCHHVGVYLHRGVLHVNEVIQGCHWDSYDLFRVTSAKCRIYRHQSMVDKSGSDNANV